MSKMSNHVVRLADGPRQLDEMDRAEALRREAAPWEYGWTDEQIDALDAPDGPLAGFDCYADKEEPRA